MRERSVLQDPDGTLERIALRMLAGTQHGFLGPACELAVRGELQRQDVLTEEASGRARCSSGAT